MIQQQDLSAQLLILYSTNKFCMTFPWMSHMFPAKEITHDVYFKLLDPVAEWRLLCLIWQHGSISRWYICFQWNVWWVSTSPEAVTYFTEVEVDVMLLFILLVLLWADGNLMKIYFSGALYVIVPKTTMLPGYRTFCLFLAVPSNTLSMFLIQERLQWAQHPGHQSGK